MLCNVVDTVILHGSADTCHSVENHSRSLSQSQIYVNQNSDKVLLQTAAIAVSSPKRSSLPDRKWSWDASPLWGW